MNDVKKHLYLRMCGHLPDILSNNGTHNYCRYSCTMRSRDTHSVQWHTRLCLQSRYFDSKVMSHSQDLEPSCSYFAIESNNWTNDLYLYSFTHIKIKNYLGKLNNRYFLQISGNLNNEPLKIVASDRCRFTSRYGDLTTGASQSCFSKDVIHTCTVSSISG